MKRLIRAAVMFSVIAMAGARSVAADGLRIGLDSGVIRGAAESGVRAFKGIPYAKPPMGTLRFLPPQPQPAWSEIRDTVAFGPACPQERPVETAKGEASQSEDCLTLNVWAPTDEAIRKAPVMVWIHGGGNTAGASSRRYYDGSSFARDGVVLVSINYRLGRLGFFAHPALTKAAKADESLANYSLLDQIAALHWVNRNITAFGGDPANVTVFGESAGGEDVLALMAIKSAQGLFHKAIVESGGGRAMPLLQEAEKAGASFLGARPQRGTDPLAFLRSLAASEVIKDQSDIGPIVDGRLLAWSPMRALAEGGNASIPLMIGTNSDEGSLVSEAPPDGMLKQFPADHLAKFRETYGGGIDDALLARSLFRDLNFTAPARWIARRASSSAPVFLYRFTHLRRSQRGRVPGAAHGAELPYVFDSWHESPSGGQLLAPEDRAFATTIHTCWVTFAKTGAPACSKEPWIPYRTDKDEIMEFGAEVAAHPDPLRAVLDLIDAYTKR